MKFVVAAIWTIAAACVSLACSNTQVQTAWSDPGVVPDDLVFEHVVAIAALRSEAEQRVVEDGFASAAIDTRVTPAYRLVSQADRADVERLRTALTRHQVDGAIVVRLVGIQEEQVFVPRSAGPYGGYYDHWHRVGSRVYEAGYYRTDTDVVVETRLYDVGEGRLLWAGTSSTINPRDVQEVIEGIVEATGKDLRKRGLVP